MTANCQTTANVLPGSAPAHTATAPPFYKGGSKAVTAADSDSAAAPPHHPVLLHAVNERMLALQFGRERCGRATEAEPVA